MVNGEIIIVVVVLEMVGTILMVVDSIIVGISIGIVKETYGTGVVILSKILDYFGRGVIMVLNGVYEYGGGVGCREMYEVEIS